MPPRGYRHTEESKRQMSVNAGRWNKGKTSVDEKERRHRANLRQERYLRRHPEQRKISARNYATRHRMRDLYHLTPERYTEMYEEQKGLCAIPSCGRPIEVIEHDHATGRTRALTCHRCNHAIGHMRDNSRIARDIAEYLEKHNG